MPSFLNDSDLSLLYTIKQTAYPIGSVYLTVDDVDPATLFGGKWEQLADIGSIHAWKRIGG
jgi:hypothetical protein